MTQTGTKRSGLVDRVRDVRAKVRSTNGGRLAWRIGVTVAGVAVIAVGVVLLPLPGPGWLIIFAGLALLATEYDRAQRLLNFARRQVSRWTQWVKRQNKFVQALVGVSAFVFLAALAVFAFWYYTR